MLRGWERADSRAEWEWGLGEECTNSPETSASASTSSGTSTSAVSTTLPTSAVVVAMVVVAVLAVIVIVGYENRTVESSALSLSKPLS